MIRGKCIATLRLLRYLLEGFVDGQRGSLWDHDVKGYEMHAGKWMS